MSGYGEKKIALANQTDGVSDPEDEAKPTVVSLEGMENRLVSAEELAKILGVSKSWIYKNLDSDEIPHYRIGKNVRFAVREVLEFLKKN